MKKCLSSLKYILNQGHMMRSLLSPLILLSGLLLTSTGSLAAGPKMGDFYLNLGGGIFAPQFTLRAGNIDGPPGQSIISASLPGYGGEAVPLIGLQLSSDIEQNIKPENRGMISLGGVFGYQLTDSFGAEIGLDLALLEIDIRGVSLFGDLLANEGETLTLVVLPPDLLPITFSGIYTLFPSSRVSPYVGFGLMLALLDNRRASNYATDIVVLDGGFELGYIAHAGIKMDVSDGMYAFADVKYGRVSNPDIKDRFGTAVSIEKFEVRHMRFGIGYPL